MDTDQLPLKSQIIRLSVSVEADIVLTRMELSPDKRGLIVGFFNTRVENGFCILWPDIEKYSKFYRKLNKGTMGSWSSNGDLVVTWTVPEEPRPEANDGGCAFIWNVQQLKNSMADPTSQAECSVLRNPFGKNVLWCRFLHDMNGHVRLVMCVIRTTVRFLFWNVNDKILTHTVATDISTNDMILGNRTSWMKSWVDGKDVKGLASLAVSNDLKQLGAVSGFENRVVIWDAVLGVQLLNIKPPNIFAGAFKGGVDIIFSPTMDKFAMIGDHNALMFVPPTKPKNNEIDAGISHMIALKNSVGDHSHESRYRVYFSGNENTLGVLHIGSQEMTVWHLIIGTKCTLCISPGKEEVFEEFCISFNGNYVVTCSSAGLIHIWNCTREKGSIAGSIDAKSTSVALGIRPDLSEIVSCTEKGDLVWYALSDSIKSSADYNVEGMKIKSTSVGSTSGRKWYNNVSRRGLSFYEPLQESSDYSRLHTVATVEEVRDRSPKLQYLEDERKRTRNAVDCCRISSQCDRAVKLLVSGAAEVWNLKTRELTITNQISVSGIRNQCRSQLLPLNEDGSILDKIRKDESVFSNTSIASLKNAAVVLSEKKDFILASDCSASLRTAQDTDTSYTVHFQEQRSETSGSIFVINVKDSTLNRELKGDKLEPQKGFTISPNGRHVACISEKYASKIVVWTCYASEGLIPDYHSLHLKYNLKKKEVVLDKIPPLLSAYGVNLISCLHPSGTSLLVQAIMNTNHSLIKVLLKYTVKKNIKISFWIRRGQSNDRNHTVEYENAVSISMKLRSPESVKTVMKYLIRRVTNEAEVADIMSCTLIKISCRYPQIFLHVIHNQDLLHELSETEVPEEEFASGKFLTSIHQSLHLARDEVKKLWNDSDNEEKSEDNKVTLRAKARVLPYKNACQIGSNGLLRHLLIHGTHHLTFASFTLKAIVNHKWKYVKTCFSRPSLLLRTYAESIFIREFISHCLLLIMFTVYSFLLRNQSTYQVDGESGNEENENATIIVLIVCVALALPSLLRELNQCRIYIKNDGLRGFVFWFGSAWNWMEVLSYANVVFLIPFGQLYLLKNGKRAIIISALAAVESLLLWSRMLFYARPFKSTGPLVIVISSIVLDIIPFLVLALCVMFGFAVAFFILYRHVNPDSKDEADSEFQSMYDSFGTFKRTFFTVFSYVFGDFDLDVIYNAPESNTVLIIFVLYMVIIAIILLNMLIAIMSESFNRVLSDEDTRFIKSRATAIDDIDSMLSARKERRLKEHLNGYLHVAIPKFIHDKVIAGKRTQTSIKRKEIWAELSAFMKENALGRQRNVPLLSSRAELAELDGPLVQGPSLPADFDVRQFPENPDHEDDGASITYSSSVSSHCFSDDVLG
eukprot:g9077.t1